MKAAALRAHKKAQRDIRAFLDGLPGCQYKDEGRRLTASEEAKRQQLIQAERRACEACWHADDTPPVGRKVSELRAELQAELQASLRKQDPEPRPMTTRERWRVAFHEGAGHATVAGKRNAGLLGVTLSECTYQSMDAVVALAGAVAERMAGFYGDHSESDLKNARAAIVAEGWRDVDQQMSVAEARAKEILAAHWLVAQNVAAALFHDGQLSGDEVRAVMGLSAFELQERERYCRQHGIAQRPPRRYAA